MAIVAVGVVVNFLVVFVPRCKGTLKRCKQACRKKKKKEKEKEKEESKVHPVSQTRHFK